MVTTLEQQLAFLKVAQGKLDTYAMGTPRIGLTLYTLADGRAVTEAACVQAGEEPAPPHQPVEPGSALEVTALTVLEQMEAHSTYVEADKIDGPRLQSGHGGGVVRVERPGVMQILITDPARWEPEHAGELGRAIFGTLLRVGVAAEQGREQVFSILGVAFPPEPDLGPLPADLRKIRTVRQLARWPKGARGGGATWAEAAWARLLRGDDPAEVRAQAATCDKHPWKIMPPAGAAQTYMYLQRRFGPPKLGYDTTKEMGCWYLTGGGTVVVSLYPRAVSVGVGILVPRVFTTGPDDVWWRPPAWIAHQAVDIMCDLLRPTWVRDVAFNPRGRVDAPKRAVKPFNEVRR